MKLMHFCVNEKLGATFKKRQLAKIAFVEERIGMPYSTFKDHIKKNTMPKWVIDKFIKELNIKYEDLDN